MRRPPLGARKGAATAAQSRTPPVCIQIESTCEDECRRCWLAGETENVTQSERQREIEDQQRGRNARPPDRSSPCPLRQLREGALGVAPPLGRAGRKSPSTGRREGVPRFSNSRERAHPSSALHRALRRMAGLVFLLVFWVLAGACVQKVRRHARRGRFFYCQILLLL